MVFRSLLVATLAVSSAHAAYDSFYFTSNASSWQCANLGYDCPPPSACSHDVLTNKYYCCIPGPDTVCWTASTQCSGGNTQAGTGQLDCGSYCCLGTRERCTETTGQTNICWATAADPFENVTDTRMNDTFSSLSSSRPAATSFTFALAQVTSALTTTTSSATATTTPAATTTTSASPTPTGATGGSDSGISGGAIAGIVVGVVLGLAVIAGAIFFFMRSRRGKTVAPSQEPYRETGYTDKTHYAGGAPQLPPPVVAPVEMAGDSQPRPVQEWYGHAAAAEMESNTSATHNSQGTYNTQYSSELPAGR